jgi:electron transfer flavoprotein beta subunit
MASQNCKRFKYSIHHHALIVYNQAMDIVVLIKQVPDMTLVRFDCERGAIDRTSAGTEINPFDLNALQAAVDLALRTKGRVICISMGPPSAESALREAIARGADKGILLTDPIFAGSDTIATSRVLAATIKHIGMPDLITTGEKTVDGDTGQVGLEVAELLQLPSAAYVDEIIGLDDTDTVNHITVVSRIWDGRYIKRLKFPCLITVTKDLNIPNPPTLRRSRFAENVEIVRMTAKDLGLSDDTLGRIGSPTYVKKVIVPPPAEKQGKVTTGCTKENIAEVLSIMREKKLIP